MLLPIGTFEPSLSKNVLKVNVSSEFFLEPLSRIHLGESGTIFLLDQDGSPILSQTEYSSHSDASTYVQNIRDGYSDQGVVYIKNDQGSNEILVYKKLNINNWLLVGFVSEEDLYDKLNKLRTSIMIFSTLLLIAAILVASWLSYGITKPLSSLALAMRSVQKGDFSSAESRIPPERIVRNEVGYVTATFRNMVEQLKYHIKIEFELKLLRQQAEYKALLMQINPHFLFNTLELLSSLVLQSRTQDSVKVIEALGKMLRFSLRINDDLIPLEEELKYLRHYISILQIRFKERLMISVEEEGSLDQREIIKFILQPLVENAVKYSFIQQDVAEVKILTYVTAEGVQLIVADNGPGMLPELVQQLYTDFENVQLNQILSSGSKHIGLRNVLARCELYYGAQFKFKIESKVDWGTRIELYLPVKGEQTHVSSDDRR
ncbi:putative sensor-like histidine kinase [compost metagenome]